MHPGLIIWPLAALIAAAGLCVIAPPRSRSLYLAPVGCTALFICTLAAVAAVVIH
ncbi:hypothetical protein ACFWR9_08890 [Streptomyces sp. NPDC058534]|uniref:hypothetical protein n=1 Tax=Streptomyces sp. NPDC058534 TaxID=3346541 RepID=UPI00365C03FB